MTIDIRARVYCSLGDIVQGSLSDTYVQGNGLVLCRGSVTLNGIYQPTLGQTVDFAYEKNGYLSRVPRRLRVLSSFADPFTRQTTVQLGCKLTMLEDLAPGNAKIVPPGVYTAASSSGAVVQYSGQSSIVFSDYAFILDNMRADIMVQDILTKIGITVSGAVPLVNRYIRNQVDLSSGYVKVVGDLLMSENYVGYLNESEQLVIRSTEADGGAGPVLRRDDIISLDAVNSGDLPAEDVKVSYSAYVVKRKTVEPTNRTAPDPPLLDPPTLEDPPNKRTTWSYEESVGDPTTTVTLYSYTSSRGEKIKERIVTKSIPYTQTWTLFNADGSTKQRLTRSRTSAHQANSRYYGDAYSNGFTPPVSPSTSLFQIVIEDHKYDAITGDQISTVRRTTETAFAASGRLSLPYVMDNEDGTKTLYTPGIGKTGALLTITTELAINTTERIRFRPPRDVPATDIFGGPTLSAGDSKEGATKVSNVVYRNYGATQQGQQAAAWNSDNLDSISDLTDSFQAALYNLVVDSSEVRIVSDPNAYTEKMPPGTQQPKKKGIKKNPLDPLEKPTPLGKDIGATGDRDGNIETLSTFVYQSGAPVVRTQTFNMPYTGDDWFEISGPAEAYYYSTVKGKPAQWQALAFGRVQNRMLLGHRNGLSLQVAPELMPPRPFDPVYLDLDGLAGQYRVNGLSWAFDASGIACSIDAMFWGGVGTT